MDYIIKVKILFKKKKSKTHINNHIDNILLLSKKKFDWFHKKII